jgi:hypothetical protein
VVNAEPVRLWKKEEKGDVCMVQQKDEELSAFCATCPQPTEVSTVLASLGCSLAFTVPSEDEGAYMHLPPLPAQFHYDGPGGIGVIYLAGPDIALDGECFPTHESRFWLYGGHNQAALHQVASALAVRWSLSWQRSGCSSSSLENVA